jgi:hypothetical protein
MRYLFLILGLLAAAAFQGQSELERAALKLAQVRSAYRELGPYSVDVFHRYYATASSAAPTTEYKGFYAQAPPMYTSELLGAKIVQDGKLRLTIDSASQVVAINKPDTAYKAIVQVDFMKLFKSCKSVGYSSSSTNDVITMHLPEGESVLPYSKIQITVNKRNLIDRIRITLNGEGSNTGEAEILYRNFRMKKPGDNLFSTSSIIEFDGVRYTLAPKYKNYTLINNIDIR